LEGKTVGTIPAASQPVNVSTMIEGHELQIEELFMATRIVNLADPKMLI
jgi:hypothetical protein